MRHWLIRTILCAVVLGLGTRATADLVDEAMAAEEAFWAARKAGDVKHVEAVLAPDYTSIESDCNGLQATEGAATAVNHLKKDLSDGAFGSYKLRRFSAQVVGHAVVLSVGWESRYTPRAGGTRAIRYTAGMATAIWAKDAGGAWKRFYYHSHWRPIHTHASESTPGP
jgi:hypothetical protein